MLGDFAGGVKRVGGGDDSPKGHDGEADDGKENGIGGKEEDDMALSNTQVRERGGDGIDSPPELVEGEVATSGGVDESKFAVVGAGGDESGDVEGVVLRKRQRLPFTVEDGVGFAESTSCINFNFLHLAISHKHSAAGPY